MRYYLLVVPPHGPCYVAAETVRDRSDDGTFRDSSYAAHVELAGSTVSTREEVESTPAGREALRAWEAHSDASFDTHMHHLSGEGRPQLRVVMGPADGDADAER